MVNLANWSMLNNASLNLRQVIAHELGHVHNQSFEEARASRTAADLGGRN
jgi:predicted SprT family Zn-dependent metalloprotease